MPQLSEEYTGVVKILSTSGPRFSTDLQKGPEQCPGRFKAALGGHFIKSSV